MPGQTAVLLECVFPSPCAFFTVAVCTIASLQESIVGLLDDVHLGYDSVLSPSMIVIILLCVCVLIHLVCGRG